MNAVLEKRGLRKLRGVNSAGLENGQSYIKVDGRRVPITHPDKVLYPKTHFTKAQVVNYYAHIAPVLLPHLKDRLLTLKRYPNGVERPFFYEKHCPEYRPEWVDTASVKSRENGREIKFCMINNLATLIWAANLADLELHTSLAKKKNLECPTAIVFDLDPGAPATILQCAEVALWFGKIFDELKLKGFTKTSGSKGMQVYVPLNTPTNFEATKTFARKLAESMEEQNPRLVTANMNRSQRKGKVLVDWGQNEPHKTTICVYSLRAREAPTVSTPVSWEEVERSLKSKDAAKLSFLPDEVLKRVEKFGDLFAPVLKLKQRVPDI
jgi:bifunctional non-homologous end joining protein LigD